MQPTNDGLEAYRVRKPFQWDVWEYAPYPGTDCKCGVGCKGDGIACTGQVGTTCICKSTSCRCTCGIPEYRYAGDVWFIPAGHPRKDIMLSNRFAVYDAGLLSVEELLKEEKYNKLLSPPPNPAEKVMSPATPQPSQPAPGVPPQPV